MDKKNLKISSKGTNYQTAKLIRKGNTVADSLAIAQQTEQFAAQSKRAKRRQRLGM